MVTLKDALDSEIHGVGVEGVDEGKGKRFIGLGYMDFKHQKAPLGTIAHPFPNLKLDIAELAGPG